MYEAPQHAEMRGIAYLGPSCIDFILTRLDSR